MDVILSRGPGRMPTCSGGINSHVEWMAPKLRREVGPSLLESTPGKGAGWTSLSGGREPRKS